jgi:RNA polymerase sigma-70 factor (ECF subfamily)
MLEPFACYLEIMDHPCQSDPDALRIFLENQPRFLGFLRQHVRSEAEAEDLLQQSLLKAIRHQEDWDGKENVLAWFYRILRNALTDHYRAQAAEGRKVENLLREPGPTLSQEERENLCSCFEGVLPTLKPEYAELLRRVDLREEEPAQVAASLGVTTNNLSVRLHRARQSLRKSLEKTCGACTRHGCLDCNCKQDGVHGGTT